MARDRALSLVAVGLVVAVGAVGVGRLEVETDITRFLPQTGDPRLGTVARAVTTSDLNRTVTLTVEADGTDRAAAAARALAERLEGSEQVAWVRSGPDEALQQAFYELYFPRRLGFAAESGAEAERLVAESSLRERARGLKARLAQPTGAFVRRIAPEDPWLLFVDRMERLRDTMQGELAVHDGVFVTEDGRHGVVLIGSRSSAFETEASRELERDIDEAFAHVQQDLGGDITLEQASVHRMALAGERSVRADVTRVSIAGSVGMVLFLLVVLGSLRHLLVGSVPIAAGLLSGIAAVAFVFDAVHGLTLAFGATLIGVAVDYVAHAMSHHLLEPSPDGPAGTLRRIWPGLLLGALTTLAGLAALGFSAIPAITEMAVFTGVGVTVALLVTRWAMPPFLPARPRPSRPLLWLARAAGAWLDRFGRRRGLAWIALLVMLAVGGAGLALARWDDDMRALAAPDPSLLAEDQRVRGRVARVDAGRFVVAFGEDAEEALERNDAVWSAVQRARGDGLVERVRSIHPLLPSRRSQRAVHAAVTSGDVWSRTAEAYAAEGFVPETLEPFREALSAPYDPLTPEDLANSAVGELASPFLVRLDDGFAALTFVSGVTDPGALAARIDPIEGALWFDQTEYMEDAYRTFRERALELIGVGLLLVCLLVAARYRNARDVAVAVGPAVAAGALALGVVGLSGQPLNLVHVLTVLLVLSMGVDYGVFLVESARFAEGPRATLVGLIVACGSTVLSFGALALSDNPAMRAMGLTTAVGVAASLLLAGALGAALRDGKNSADSDT